MQGSSIPSQYILLLVDLAVERGCSIESICSGTQLTLPSLAQLGARVSNQEADRLTMNVLAQTSDPSLGLALGQRLNLSAHAVIGQAFLTCSNLAEVLDLSVSLRCAAHRNPHTTDQGSTPHSRSRWHDRRIG